jgi:hypothetical protein
MSDGVKLHSTDHNGGSWLNYWWFTIKVYLGLWPNRGSLVSREISIRQDRHNVTGLKMYARGRKLIDKSQDG